MYTTLTNVMNSHEIRLEKQCDESKKKFETKKCKSVYDHSFIRFLETLLLRRYNTAMRTVICLSFVNVSV